jgi:hypothetical protein
VSSSHPLTAESKPLAMSDEYSALAFEQQRQIKDLKYRKLRQLERLALQNKHDEFFQYLHETPFPMSELARDSPPCSEYDRALRVVLNFIAS